MPFMELAANRYSERYFDTGEDRSNAGDGARVSHRL